MGAHCWKNMRCWVNCFPEPSNLWYKMINQTNMDDCMTGEDLKQFLCLPLLREIIQFDFSRKGWNHQVNDDCFYFKVTVSVAMPLMDDHWWCLIVLASMMIMTDTSGLFNIHWGLPKPLTAGKWSISLYEWNLFDFIYITINCYNGKNNNLKTYFLWNKMIFHGYVSSLEDLEGILIYKCVCIELNKFFWTSFLMLQKKCAGNFARWKIRAELKEICVEKTKVRT